MARATPPLKVALVGCGWVASLQIDNGLARLPELFEVVACCDVNQSRVNAFADHYGIRDR